MIKSPASPILQLSLRRLRNRDKQDQLLAQQLFAFSATEAGSALDMLRAAELCPVRKYRRLFFRHAMDEARHADLFRRMANRIDPRSLPDSNYAVIHATRQNLFERYGLVRFLAFVYLSERQAARQFATLRNKYSERPEVADLFDNILRDERFHVQYSKALLDSLTKHGKQNEVRRALVRTRFQAGWDAWRRSGRRIGDFMSRGLMAALYLFLLPPFALACRVLEKPTRGWQPVPALPKSIEEARRQS